MTKVLVKERPILFSSAMVRALLDGSKTQTRRIIKPQPTQPRQAGYILHATDKSREGGFQWSDADCKNLSEPVHCPYGQPGERLWVRETCRAEEEKGLDGVRYVADNIFRPIENTREAADAWVDLYHYGKRRGATVPPIHTPRWTSRLLLEIIAVRVERLQGISETDAKAEGIESRDGEGFYWRDYELKNGWHANHPVMSYETLWRAINGPNSWAANPWVWVVEFKVIEPAHV